MPTAKGLLIVNTGQGKGKTTAAMGLAFRALGHGMRVCVIQFIKGKWKSGELEAAQRFGDLLEIHVLGRGFTWDSENLAEDTRIAQEAWQFAKQTLSEGRHDVVVLDELTYLIKYGMVDEGEVLRTLASRPEAMHVVVTGRDAPTGLVKAADLVTEMLAIKHPYGEGVKAQKGIEY
jgi:cob(I)alamin adenosyltransferase